MEQQVLRQHAARQDVIDARAHVRQQVVGAADRTLAAAHSAEVEAEEAEPRLARAAEQGARRLGGGGEWEEIARRSGSTGLRARSQPGFEWRQGGH